MNTVQITFLGVALYEKREDEPGLIVRFPGAVQEKKVWDVSHFDDEIAQQHFPWLYAYNATQELRIPLNGATLEIQGDPPPPATPADAFKDILPLSRIAPPAVLLPTATDAQPEGPTITRINLLGGSLQGGRAIQNLTFQKHFKQPPTGTPTSGFLGFYWDSFQQDANLTIRFGPRDMTIPLKASDWDAIYLLNWDEPVPTRASVTVTPCNTRKRVLDEDFRWLYHLLDPVGANGSPLRDKWRGTLKGKFLGGVKNLPYPMHDCPDVTDRGVEVGTCMGGGIGP